MQGTGNIIKDRPVEVSAALVIAGLLIGTVLGGTVGCSLFARHMAFLHGGVTQSCDQNSIVLFGSSGVGGMIGASCGLLAVVFLYHRGRLMVQFSLMGAAFSLVAFAAWVFSGEVVLGIENYIFTGAFIALCGMAVGTVAGLIADHLNAS
ncbi:hypothetical protein ACFL4R_01990 [Nitrospirota bacterium]